MKWLSRLFRKPPPPDEGLSDLEVLCDILRRFEGLRLKPYLCSGGKWTIGYGSTRTLGERSVSERTRPITEDMAERLLKRDAKKFYLRMQAALRDDASSGAKIAFSSLAYNVGTSKVLNSRALLEYNAGRLKGAEGEFKEFRLAKGRILTGLVKRRGAEWELVRQSEGDH